MSETDLASQYRVGHAEHRVGQAHSAAEGRKTEKATRLNGQERLYHTNQRWYMIVAIE